MFDKYQYFLNIFTYGAPYFSELDSYENRHWIDHFTTRVYVYTSCGMIWGKRFDGSVCNVASLHITFHCHSW